MEKIVLKQLTLFYNGENMIMEIKYLKNNFKMSTIEVEKLIRVINKEMKEDPYSDEYTYYFLLNDYVNKILIDNISFDFYLEICGFQKRSYKYVFNQLLDILPDILKSLKIGGDFVVDMIEQGYNNYYNFSIKKEFYLVKSINIYQEPVGKDEILNVSDLILTFDNIKNNFLELIANHFSDELYQIYYDYLNFDRS
ncbi:hypothetical protein ACDW34_12415 [Acinetobacter piscicola]